MLSRKLSVHRATHDHLCCSINPLFLSPCWYWLIFQLESVRSFGPSDARLFFQANDATLFGLVDSGSGSDPTNDGCTIMLEFYPTGLAPVWFYTMPDGGHDQ